jgi:hypothetical protein
MYSPINTAHLTLSMRLQRLTQAAHQGWPLRHWRVHHQLQLFRTLCLSLRQQVGELLVPAHQHACLQAQLLPRKVEGPLGELVVST